MSVFFPVGPAPGGGVGEGAMLPVGRKPRDQEA